MRSCSPSRYSVSTVSSVRQTMRRGGKCCMGQSICRTHGGLSPQPLRQRSLPHLPLPFILARRHRFGETGGPMTPLERIQSMKMPFAELKGVTFVEADLDHVVARMQVRPELCTLRNTIHGGA